MKRGRFILSINQSDQYQTLTVIICLFLCTLSMMVMMKVIEDDVETTTVSGEVNNEQKQ